MANDDMNLNADQNDFFGPIDDSFKPIEDPAPQPPEMLVEFPDGLTPQEQEQKPQLTNEEMARYQYWQSQADKYKAELAAYQQFTPLIQYIQNDPEALAVLQQRALEKSGQPRQEEYLTPPNPPSRPSDFNEYDAYNEPDSSSYQYRVQRDDYNVQLTEYLVKKDQMREDAYRKSLEAQAQDMKRRDALQQTYGMLTGQYGFNQNEAIEFVQMFSDDRSINMDNLVELYRLRRAANAQPQRQQQTKWSPAPPVAMNTLQTQRQLDDNQRFDLSLGMYSWKNQKR